MVQRLFVEKMEAFRRESILWDLQENLGISGVTSLRTVIRYDIFHSNQEISALLPILTEGNVDCYHPDALEISSEFVVGVRPLDGQYDARAAFAQECLKLSQPEEDPQVKCATIYLFSGNPSEKDREKIQKYLINPVESVACLPNDPPSLLQGEEPPDRVEILEEFLNFTPEQLETYRIPQGFAMSLADLTLVQGYFQEEGRNPTITELKVIDTYWSDHCRHTTFMTELGEITIHDPSIQSAFDDYLATRKSLGITKDICLMDLATIGAKHLKSVGKLEDLDESEEINACSIRMEVDGEPWLLMFKNETHNHPTEIEPFGGAATCLGGAIRDPLSGRSYVFGALRVTGCADPHTPFEETLAGKLPQKTITQKAAQGYSSYGNQIGLTTGGVYELYHPDYVAKRMEVGAVIAACPASHVLRKAPSSGDAILLLGGRTGRDGIGGATGSSKVHTAQSTVKSASEVQKGNPVEERKIQRLFRNPAATTLIKKCNDFGAGGVCVAIGELADSLDIDLNKVPKKYQGLDGTELAISESQERMAVVVSPDQVADFMALCQGENLEVTEVAQVTDTGDLVMRWNEQEVFRIKRRFLDSNGAKSTTDVEIPEGNLQFFDKVSQADSGANSLIRELGQLNCGSQKGLGELFDSTIGGGTVLMPFGGKEKITPPEGLALKIPDFGQENSLTALMTFGCRPDLGVESPFHAGIYSVVECLSKIACLGGDTRKVRLSNQEYFERMVDKTAFGKPVSALLGVLQAQKELEVPSIGGKDSMSGNFGDKKVPPTVITFGVGYQECSHIISPEFKEFGHKLVFIPIKTKENHIPDYQDLKAKYATIYEEISQGNLVAAKTIGYGGIGVAVTKMALGNEIGVHFKENVPLFRENHGGILVEVLDPAPFVALGCEIIGETLPFDHFVLPDGDIIGLPELKEAFEATLEPIFPTTWQIPKEQRQVETLSHPGTPSIKRSTALAKPRVFIPAFPGTNCELDTARAFQKAGADCEILVFRNGSPSAIQETIQAYAKALSQAQILAIPGGFSASDEPDGSAKFIATVFRNPRMKEAVQHLLDQQDGLILGICNGFQALIKLGLLPEGKITDLKPGMPTLTHNLIGRHVSCMVDTRVASCLSPWLSATKVGEVHAVAMSHGEGRFVAEGEALAQLVKNGQIATQYVDPQGLATLDGRYNPNGSTLAIEGLTSLDGRILGKMGHSERAGEGLYQNIQGNANQPIFAGGVNYYK